MKRLALACALPALLSAAPDLRLEGRLAQGGLVHGLAPPGAASVTLDGRNIALAPDRRFLLAFDRDAPAAATLVIGFASGAPALRRPLRIERRAWPLRNLPTLPKGTPRTAAERALRASELARINAARATRVTSEGWRQWLRWPVTGRISGVFGAQTIYAGEPGSYHSGVDIARPTGTPIVAPADGVVILASPPRFSVEGNLILLDHGMGLTSAFLHLSRVDVRAGQSVRQGQPLGTIGATGRATGPHLHWGMKWGEARIDPQPLVGAMMQ